MRRAAARALALTAGLLVPTAALAAPGRATGNPPSDVAAAARVTTTQELVLSVGEHKTLPATDVANYSLATPGVAEVKVTPDLGQFIVVGLKPGTTSLLLLKRSGGEMTYAISVFAKPPQVVEAELGQLLAGYAGIRIRKVGGRFFIEGTVSTDTELRRVQHIAGLFPGQVDTLAVIGGVATASPISIRIDFFFVQFNKSSNYAVGMSWPTKFGGPGAITLGGSQDLINGTTAASAVGAVTQPLPSLDLAATGGWAKVLKQSSVVTTSGSEASFDSGGEQNFAVAAGLTGAIQKIAFGTNVAVLPTYDPATRQLEVKITADVSDLTPAAGSAGLPGRQTSKVSTLVNLKLGESIVVSGIKTKNKSSSTTGLPLLKDIPILGALFGSVTSSEAEVEGALFVVPSVVESVPRKNLDIVQTALDGYDAFHGNIEVQKSFPHAPPSYR